MNTLKMELSVRISTAAFHFALRAWQKSWLQYEPCCRKSSLIESGEDVFPTISVPWSKDRDFPRQKAGHLARSLDSAILVEVDRVGVACPATQSSHFVGRQAGSE